MTQNNQIVRLELWKFGGIWYTLSLVLLASPLWLEVIVPSRVKALDQTEKFHMYILCEVSNLRKIEFTKIELLEDLTVCK